MSRIFTYMIYFLVGGDPNPLYREQYFLGVVHASTKSQAIAMARTEWPNYADKELKAMSSHGKTAPKFYERRLSWLEAGYTGVYRGRRDESN